MSARETVLRPPADVKAFWRALRWRVGRSAGAAEAKRVGSDSPVTGQCLRAGRDCARVAVHVCVLPMKACPWVGSGREILDATAIEGIMGLGVGAEMEVAVGDSAQSWSAAIVSERSRRSAR